VEQLNIGIVGACGRGASFRTACDALDVVRIHAVCDTNIDELDAAKARLGADEAYADYVTMIEKSDLAAVIIGTPMHLHVPQSVAALERGLHVLSEVPAGVSIDECRDLVAAATAGTGVYMMAENYTYARHCVMVREMARRGEFGTPYYAEGEYLHELKEMNEVTRWRRTWQTGINGITYGTHSLGPILQWMPGDRVASVSCAGSGHHYRDPRGDLYENEDSCVMLCRMASGGLVKIRVDMLSASGSGRNAPTRTSGSILKRWRTSSCRRSGKRPARRRGKPATAAATTSRSSTSSMPSRANARRRSGFTRRWT